MQQLIEAMREEKQYISDRMNNIDTSLIDRLRPFGFNSLNEYFVAKHNYLFEQWKPEIYYIDVKTLTTELEKAVQNNQYGIYISTSTDLYAFHGSDEIDYDLCEALGITVAEVFYKGGTIIGGPEDLGIEIIAPIDLGLNHKVIISKFYNIIKEYENNVIIDGNDILVDGKKVLGSMSRHVGNAFVWAAQISFGNHDKIIDLVCKKKSLKTPGRINNIILTKDYVLQEVKKWLQKQ